MRQLLALLKHPDPQGPDGEALDLAHWRHAVSSLELQHFRAAIQSAGYSLTESVLAEVSTFFEYDRWRTRFDPLGRGGRELYDRHRGWALNLLWYAMLQATGDRYPVSVILARDAGRPRAESRHLDFGSGPGVTSQLFASQGYDIELADIEPSLLEFAKFRHQRRGLRATYIDLRAGLRLGESRYDVITAIDSLQHAPDFIGTVQALHRALKPRGLLYANVDVNPLTAGHSGWFQHVGPEPRYRRLLQGCGLEPEGNFAGYRRYRRVDGSGPRHTLRRVRDAVILSPVVLGARSGAERLLRRPGR